MEKTSREITSDLYALIGASYLAQMVNGKVYLEGTRPRDSRAEDIVIVYLAGQPGEIQSCMVNVQVFVPDVDPWEDGVQVEDYQRTLAIEREAAQMVVDLTCAVSNYRIRLNETIHTAAAEDIGQHFVVVPLRVDYWADASVDDIEHDIDVFRKSQTRYFKVKSL